MRNIIAKIPNLSIFIDEVHHASDGDIKLRQVVNKWMETESFNSVLGFSGTPYLASAESVKISSELSLENKNFIQTVLSGCDVEFALFNSERMGIARTFKAINLHDLSATWIEL